MRSPDRVNTLVERVLSCGPQAAHGEVIAGHRSGDYCPCLEYSLERFSLRRKINRTGHETQGSQAVEIAVDGTSHSVQAQTLVRRVLVPLSYAPANRTICEYSELLKLQRVTSPTQLVLAHTAPGVLA